jgi:hypothetical protein
MKVGFEDLAGDGVYYAPLAKYDGYDGFNFSDMFLLTKAGMEHFGLEDTGFKSVMHGHAEGFTAYHYAYVTYGSFASANGQKFNLKSGYFANALARHKYPVHIYGYDGRSYVYGVTLNLGHHATYINFGGALNGVTSVVIFSSGSYRCLPVAFDNLKVEWIHSPAEGFRSSAPHPQHAVPWNHPLMGRFMAMSGQANNHFHYGGIAGDVNHFAYHNHIVPHDHEFCTPPDLRFDFPHSDYGFF